MFRSRILEQFSLGVIAYQRLGTPLPLSPQRLVLVRSLHTSEMRTEVSICV